MSDFILRASNPGDAAAMTELFEQPMVRDGTLRLPYTPEAGVADWLGGFGKTDGERRMIVAEADGAARGFIVLQRFQGRLAHSGDIFIAVHDAWQGRGIGRALLAAALDVADNWMGLIRVQLEVLADNERAIRLYERFGFEIEGRGRAGTLRRGVLVDHFMMARLRPPPPRRPEDLEAAP